MGPTLVITALLADEEKQVSFGHLSFLHELREQNLAIKLFRERRRWEGEQREWKLRALQQLTDVQDDVVWHVAYK